VATADRDTIEAERRYPNAANSHCRPIGVRGRLPVDRAIRLRTRPPPTWSSKARCSDCGRLRAASDDRLGHTDAGSRLASACQKSCSPLRAMMV